MMASSPHPMEPAPHGESCGGAAVAGVVLLLGRAPQTSVAATLNQLLQHQAATARMEATSNALASPQCTAASKLSMPSRARHARKALPQPTFSARGKE
jgi:hypothetical protein